MSSLEGVPLPRPRHRLTPSAALVIPDPPRRGSFEACRVNIAAALQDCRQFHARSTTLSPFRPTTSDAGTAVRVGKTGQNRNFHRLSDWVPTQHRTCTTVRNSRPASPDAFSAKRFGPQRSVNFEVTR